MENKPKNKYDVIVIGAGASGIMAAISAARCGVKVLLIEHLSQIGKKILATGNGKCNYTNELQGVNFYRGEDPAFVVPVFQQFSKDDTVAFMEELGIYPKIKNGYYYPYSEQALSVVEVLSLALKNHNVQILCDCEILQMKKVADGFKIQTNKGIFATKSCIFATGLLAGKKCGCDGSAFPHLEAFGHKFIDVVPALVQMKSDDSFLKNLAGIRAEIRLKIYENGQFLSEDTGELLHIDGGISGIVSFQLSRYASKGLLQGHKIHVDIDYCPSLTKEELTELFIRRFGPLGQGKSVLEAMIGLYHYKLAMAFLEKSRIDCHKNASSIQTNEIQTLVSVIKGLTLKINGTKGFEDAQVCAGGLDTAQFYAETLESRLVSGLYACGELLDVDGICGGYNLQWAWSSGYVSGQAAAKRIDILK